MQARTISLNNLSDLLGVSRATVEAWVQNGKYRAYRDTNGKAFFYLSDLSSVPEIASMSMSKWDAERRTKPSRRYTSIELFAGAGGLALGLEMAGFSHVALNEFDHNACETLRLNRPEWMPNAR